MTITKEQVEAIYEAARHVGISGEQADRFLGTLKLCGLALSALEEARPVAKDILNAVGEWCDITSKIGFATRVDIEALREGVEAPKGVWRSQMDSDASKDGTVASRKPLPSSPEALSALPGDGLPGTHPAAPSAAVPASGEVRAYEFPPSVLWSPGEAHALDSETFKQLVPLSAPTSPPAVADGRGEAVTLDFSIESMKVLEGIDYIFKHYSTTFNRTPDTFMQKVVRETKEMLFIWWGAHREEIRAALSAPPSVESQDARRLDAIEKNMWFLEPQYHIDGGWRCGKANKLGQAEHYASSMRAAIDAAIAAKEKP